MDTADIQFPYLSFRHNTSYNPALYKISILSALLHSELQNSLQPHLHSIESMHYTPLTLFHKKHTM